MISNQSLPEPREVDANELASFQLVYTLQSELCQRAALRSIQERINKHQTQYEFRAQVMPIGGGKIKVICTHPRQLTDLSLVLADLKNISEDEGDKKHAHNDLCFSRAEIVALPSKKFVLRDVYDVHIRTIKQANKGLQTRIEEVSRQPIELRKQLEAQTKSYQMLEGANRSLEQTNEQLTHQLQQTIQTHGSQLEIIGRRADQAEQQALELNESYALLETTYNEATTRTHQLSTTLEATSEGLTRLQEDNAQLRARLDIAPKAKDFSLEELGVMTARNITGTAYQSAVEAYDKAFPQRMEEEVQEALITDENTFILTPKILGLVQSLNLDARTSLDELLSASQERTLEFQESPDYSKLWLPYQGALSIQGVLSLGTSANPIQKRMADDAEKAIKTFLDKSESWGRNRELAQEFMNSVRARKEMYNLTHSSYNTSTLPFTIPLISFAANKGDRLSLSYVIPCTPETADKNFTHAVIGDLTESIHESIQTETLNHNDVRYALGSPVIALEFPREERSIVPALIQRVNAACSKKVLSKLGMTWKHYSLGEIYD